MTTALPPLKPLIFELKYRREAYIANRRKPILTSGDDRNPLVADEYIRDAERDKTLPERPPQFNAMAGTFEAVAKRAEELNDAQIRSGFLHYFFFPEATPADVNPNHPKDCKSCRIAREKRDGTSE